MDLSLERASVTGKTLSSCPLMFHVATPTPELVPDSCIPSIESMMSSMSSDSLGLSYIWFSIWISSESEVSVESALINMLLVITILLPEVS